jgi:hypothetical protein
MDDPQGFLADCGWQATLSAPGAPEANHVRSKWRQRYE